MHLACSNYFAIVAEPCRNQYNKKIKLQDFSYTKFLFPRYFISLHVFPINAYTEETNVYTKWRLQKS